jgi:hypothetical protein
MPRYVAVCGGKPPPARLIRRKRRWITDLPLCVLVSLAASSIAGAGASPSPRSLFRGSLFRESGLVSQHRQHPPSNHKAPVAGAAMPDRQRRPPTPHYGGPEEWCPDLSVKAEAHGCARRAFDAFIRFDALHLRTATPCGISFSPPPTNADYGRSSTATLIFRGRHDLHAAPVSPQHAVHRVSSRMRHETTTISCMDWWRAWMILPLPNHRLRWRLVVVY